MRLGVTLLFVASITALGCSSSGGGGGTSRGGEGAPCFDGTNCQHGLACVVVTNDPQGVCTAPPAACAGTLSCDCVGDLESSCTSGSSCEGISGDYTVGCFQSGRQEGETCSALIGCDTGLYCYVASAGHAGTCTALPSACSAGATCECLQNAHPCNNYECSAGGGAATFVCR